MEVISAGLSSEELRKRRRIFEVQIRKRKQEDFLNSKRRLDSDEVEVSRKQEYLLVGSRRGCMFSCDSGEDDLRLDPLEVASRGA